MDLHESDSIPRWPGVGVPGLPAALAPALLRLVCQMALADRDRPVALIVPHGEASAAIATVLCARELAPNVMRRPIELLDQLSYGDLVNILPDGGVYRFGGRASAGFWLAQLQASAVQSSLRLWVPDKEAWRVQPTLRLRPMGGPNRGKWLPPKETPWESFSGTEVRGNPALGGLAVVLVGSRSIFEKELIATGYALASSDVAVTVADGLIRGVADEDGDVEIVVPRGAAGAPLVAVARTHQAAASVSARNPDRPIVFLSTRVADVLADRSTVDAVGARHRFLLVASPNQREEVAELRHAGWLVIEPRRLESPATGLASLDRASDASRWETRAPGVLDQKSVELEEAFAAFDRLGALAGEHTIQDEDVATCLQILRSAFFEASDWLSAPGTPELEALEDGFRELRSKLPRLRSIIGLNGFEAADACRAALDRFALRSSQGTMTLKGECVFKLATAAALAPHWRQAIVAGHGRSATLAADFLESLGLSLPCLTPSLLVDHPPFSRINILSMMRREAFARLIDPWPAPDIMFLGYQHEITVYRQRLAARDRLRRRLAPDEQTSARFPFLAPHQAPAELPAPPPTASVVEPRREPSMMLMRPTPRPPLAPGEQQRPARLCRFAGQSWMAVALEKSMARVRPSRDGLLVTPCKGRDLLDGDLVLMRDGTDRDVVRDMAESMIGTEGYETLRKHASLWRDRLVGTRLSAEALRLRLAEHGVERGLAAIRYWIAEEGPIGPINEDIAIPAIAEALGENPEAAEWVRCIEAVQHIRGLHTRAGFGLTEALTQACGGSLVEHSDHETPIMLPWGVVWLLEVEQAAQPEPWPYTQINRLRWDSDSWRRRLLARQLLNEIEDIT